MNDAFVPKSGTLLSIKLSEVFILMTTGRGFHFVRGFI